MFTHCLSIVTFVKYTPQLPNDSQNTVLVTISMQNSNPQSFVISATIKVVSKPQQNVKSQ